MYYCENCNYKTEYSGNFCIHKKSKKHIKNIVEKSITVAKKLASDNNVSDNIIKVSINSINYSCKYCGSNFNHKSSLSRHKKICNQNNKTPYLEKELLETKLKLEFAEKETKLKAELAEKEKILMKKIEEDKDNLIKDKDNLIKEKSELLNTFMANANNIINNAQNNTNVTAEAIKTVSVSALKYANEKFKNTPALLPLENFNINNLDFNNEKDKAQLIEILIYNGKQKSLDKLLGDHIVKEYKKDNPEEQIFHTTDCSRLNYIVRELIENALSWSIDKNGIKICQSIVQPLIKKCISALMEHQKYLLQEMSKGDLYKQKDVELILEVLMSIDSGTLETDINKYIAPYFNLDKK
jgi:hypothetical protein